MKRRGVVILAAVVAALMAAGCAEKKERYATPSELCGVRVDPAVLRPVLLAGEQLTTSSAYSNVKTQRCRVFVDGEAVLSVERGTERPDENHRATWDARIPQGTVVNIGDEGRAIDVYVAAAWKCAVKGEQRVFLASAERFSPKPVFLTLPAARRPRRAPARPRPGTTVPCRAPTRDRPRGGP